MTAFIHPEWPLPDNVYSLITTRLSPVKINHPDTPYAEFNLGDHVGDDLVVVTQHRQQLIESAGLPAMPAWQKQVHGTQVQILGDNLLTEADACYTNQAGQVCVMLTADCLPVLFVSRCGNEVAAAHAGWRGLLNGVLENTLAHFSSNDILAYLGPAISQRHYQVGQEVYAAFVSDNQHAKKAFCADGDKYRMSIIELAKQRLQANNITSIYGGDYCTYADQRFYSYRQACHEGDGQTGRMASLIWRV